VIGAGSNQYSSATAISIPSGYERAAARRCGKAVQVVYPFRLELIKQKPEKGEHHL
jgi:hypothetical protein